MIDTPHHQCKIRVYAEDVDFMGIVYHANYIRYFERARTELLRQSNLLLSELVQTDILFAINELAIKYILPARLDDLLTISTGIKEQTACSIMFNQCMRNEQNNLICEANIKVVCVDARLKPKRLPHVFARTKE
jgi:acyl-CoA thioester hydrolase